MTTTNMSKTELLLATAKGAKGVTAEQLTEATGQSMQTIRSRIYSLTKAGKLEAIEGTSPRHYRAVKVTAKAQPKATAKKATTKKAPAKKATSKK